MQKVIIEDLVLRKMEEVMLNFFEAIEFNCACSFNVDALILKVINV